MRWWLSQNWNFGRGWMTSTLLWSVGLTHLKKELDIISLTKKRVKLIFKNN
jgi:hypothetical protein